jgi:hypothetical protein
MITRRLRLPAVSTRDLLLATGAALFTAVLAYAGSHKLGLAGLLTPLAVLAAAYLLARPVVAVTLVVGLVVLFEGPSFGLFTFTQRLYVEAYKDISILDVLVALAIVSVGVDVIRRGRRLRVPRSLAIPLVMLALGMVGGVVVGRAAGASLRFAVTSEHVLGYLLLLPIAVANLEIDRRQVTRLLGGAMVLAIVKAVLGLVEVAGHLGTPIEGTATLTYYEPTANWLIMIAILTCFAAVLARARPPLWMLLGSPLLIACLLLSYRRSFWIGAALGVLLVLMLGTTPVGRRLLVPSALAVAASIWLLGSIHFQSNIPIVKRLTSLQPAKVEANREDRYRLDERANVEAAIRAHPITGLGATIPWRATARTLPLEGEGGQGREYVHFAALWFWMKIGILGLFAYVGVILASMWLAFWAWRSSHEPLLRAFALASLCGFAGLVAIDTTASFTGVEARFTVLFAAQLGVLAQIIRTGGSSQDEADDEPALPAIGPPLAAPLLPAA